MEEKGLLVTEHAIRRFFERVRPPIRHRGLAYEALQDFWRLGRKIQAPEWWKDQAVEVRTYRQWVLVAKEGKILTLYAYKPELGGQTHEDPCLL